MKKALIAVAVLASLGVILVARGGPQQDDDDAAQLRLQVAQMQLRIGQLEHAAGKTPAPAASGATASAEPVRTMVLVSISKVDHTGDHAEAIARLQRGLKRS